MLPSACITERAAGMERERSEEASKDQTNGATIIRAERLKKHQIGEEPNASKKVTAARLEVFHHVNKENADINIPCVRAASCVDSAAFDAHCCSQQNKPAVQEFVSMPK